jgi:hypothetical protein
VHAAGESSPGDLSEGTFAVVLTARDEEDLMAVAWRLIRARVRFTPIYEPDAPFDGALMALGLEPRGKEELRKHLSALPLLK